MDKLSLKAEELIYLALTEEVDEVFGIANPFEMMGEEQIQAELVKAENALSDKGVLELDFDGNSVLNAGAQKVIDVMFRCEGFALCSSQTGKETKNSVWYIKGEDAVKSVVGEAGYELTSAAKQELEELLVNSINWAVYKGSLPEETVTFAQPELEKLRHSGKGHMLKKLMEAGMSETAAGMTEQAFALASNYHSFIFAKTDGAKDSVRSVMFFGNENGVIEMISERGDEANVVIYKTSEAETLKNKLRSETKWFTGKQG